jgi:hypothetical protein
MCERCAWGRVPLDSSTKAASASALALGVGLCASVPAAATIVGPPGPGIKRGGRHGLKLALLLLVASGQSMSSRDT